MILRRLSTTLLLLVASYFPGLLGKLAAPKRGKNTKVQVLPCPATASNDPGGRPRHEPAPWAEHRRQEPPHPQGGHDDRRQEHPRQEPRQTEPEQSPARRLHKRITNKKLAKTGAKTLTPPEQQSFTIPPPPLAILGRLRTSPEPVPTTAAVVVPNGPRPLRTTVILRNLEPHVTTAFLVRTLMDMDDEPLTKQMRLVSQLQNPTMGCGSLMRLWAGRNRGRNNWSSEVVELQLFRTVLFGREEFVQQVVEEGGLVFRLVRKEVVEDVFYRSHLIMQNHLRSYFIYCPQTCARLGRRMRSRPLHDMWMRFFPRNGVLQTARFVGEKRR